MKALIILLLLFLESFSKFVPYSLFELSQKVKSESLLSGCMMKVESACDPCYMAPLAPLCEDWKKACISNICVPMCTRLVYDVKVSGGGSSNIGKVLSQSKQVQHAVKTHLIMHGCAHLAQCCSDSDVNVDDWLEHRNYGGYFPSVALPVQSSYNVSCSCSECKSALKVSVSTKNLCSNFFEVKSPPPSSFEVNFKHSKVNRKDQVSKHKSFAKKCKLVSEVINMNLALMKTQFVEGACKCLGCCAGECFFPSPVYKGLDDALKSSPQKQPPS